MAASLQQMPAVFREHVPQELLTSQVSCVWACCWYDDRSKIVEKITGAIVVIYGLLLVD
jgi:hypothetical protein